MVVGFVSCVWAGALRAALSSSGAFGVQSWPATCSVGLFGLGSKMGGSNEPPFVGRFALASVISTRRKLRDNLNYRAAN